MSYEVGQEVSICATGWWRKARVIRVKRGGKSIVVAYALKSGRTRQTSVRVTDLSLQPADFVPDTAAPLRVYLDRPVALAPAPTLAEVGR